MMDIHKIIMRTLKVVPKAWDMDYQNFNSDCHRELTDKEGWEVLILNIYI